MTGSSSSFLTAFMPVLPWLILVAGLLIAWAFLARAWMQRWNAQRHQVESPRQALQQARDVLATVISSGMFFGDARDQAISAYEAVGKALSKEITSK